MPSQYSSSQILKPPQGQSQALQSHNSNSYHQTYQIPVLHPPKYPSQSDKHKPILSLPIQVHLAILLAAPLINLGYNKRNFN